MISAITRQQNSHLSWPSLCSILWFRPRLSGPLPRRALCRNAITTSDWFLHLHDYTLLTACSPHETAKEIRSGGKSMKHYYTSFVKHLINARRTKSKTSRTSWSIDMSMLTCLELMNSISFSLATIRQRKIKIWNIVFENKINCNAIIWAKDVVQTL